MNATLPSQTPSGSTLQPLNPSTLPVQCAWCRLWRVDGAWIAELPFVLTPGVKVSHGICPACAETALRFAPQN